MKNNQYYTIMMTLDGIWFCVTNSWFLKSFLLALFVLYFIALVIAIIKGE